MPRKFTLTEANYHSRAARRRWLSSSDVKAAKRCEAAWLADYCGKIKHKENKPAFAFGHLFEAALTLPGPQYHQYLAAHPELCSSRGPTKASCVPTWPLRLSLPTPCGAAPTCGASCGAAKSR